MVQPLHFLKSKFSSLFVFSLLLLSLSARADEDSCWAYMLVNEDHLDPMTMHFDFAGTVPVGSFQFLGSWDFGDGNTSTDSCPVHTYLQPGTYLVCLSFSICIGGGMSCHDDTCVSVTVGNLAGIENPDGGLHNFYFYPNPVKSLLYTRSDALKDPELKIMDATGRCVYHGRPGNDNGIDISILSEGLYLIEASDGKNIIQRKLVIQD
jgi:hypothetical protein